MVTQGGGFPITGPSPPTSEGWTDAQMTGLYPELGLGALPGPPMPFTQASAVTLCMEEEGHRLPAPKLFQNTPKTGADSVHRDRKGEPTWPTLGQGAHSSQCVCVPRHTKGHTYIHKMDPQSHTDAQTPR